MDAIAKEKKWGKKWMKICAIKGVGVRCLMANAIFDFHFCFGTTIQFYLPVHFSTASKSSKSGQQQHPQRRPPGRTTGNDQKSRPRVWSFGLHILLLFGSRFFSQISFALSFILGNLMKYAKQKCT